MLKFLQLIFAELSNKGHVVSIQKQNLCLLLKNASLLVRYFAITRYRKKREEESLKSTFESFMISQKKDLKK